MGSHGIVEMAIDDLAEEFQESPDEFFNEHDLQSRFFCRLYLEFKNLIHLEYPTRKRFIKEKTSDKNYISGKHCFEPETNEGVRDHYALAIFKEEFYNNYKNELDGFGRLSDDDISSNLNIRDTYMDFVFEFKYITSGGISAIREIEFKIFKLKEATESRNKYLLIFIKKIFGIKEFKQIIEQLNEVRANENGLEILIFSK